MIEHDLAAFRAEMRRHFAQVKWLLAATLVGLALIVVKVWAS